MHELTDPRPHAFELPPLKLLVAFEAAARQLSFTRAGDEIALTQSAVSRQIQALEERLGVALFRRMHRALALTDAGRTFQAAVRAALTGLDRATRELKRIDRARTVVVTTTAGFAGLWLIPRLAGFVAAHPGVDVRISANHAIADLERDGVDVAVRYQAVAALPANGVLLFGETVYPVCSPKLRRSLGAALAVPADLASCTLLRMEPDGGHALRDWDLWLHAMGLADLRFAGVLHFSSYDQLIQAAIAGQGIALGMLPLIDRLLKTRKLVQLFPGEVASPRGYCMLASSSAARKPEVAAFARWLTLTARGPGSAGPKGRAPS